MKLETQKSGSDRNDHYEPRSIRFAGIDVGGTFTDLALWDPDEGEIRTHKLLTTPDDPSRAIRDGLVALGERAEAIVHGTTLVTNALIERKGAHTGLITTEGYRDVLEIGSELRYDTFDLFITRPEPLVPRVRRLTVPERTAADGSHVEPLNEKAVEAAARRLVGEGAEAVAVAFFNSYRNPAHEQQAVELIRKLYPKLAVCASADIAPEIREYERFSTAAANAYVQPMASAYLGKLLKMLRIPLFVMLSDGGVTTARAAAEHPITLLESGPAAGAMATAHLAAAADWNDVIAFDMGGTTAKISLIHGSVPQRTHSMEVARVHRFKKGSGLPIRAPVIELIEIGAGGGSIGSIDSLGLLKVGPRSAGAAPGPACYGAGGTDATVTDADLHLGYISADSFLGGRFRLQADRAEAVLANLGRGLGVDSTAAAAGIRRIVDNNMATAARIHVAEQGRDPRHYRLVAFGGAGPVHAYNVARLLQVREVVFPRAAGVASAIGMLVAPRSVEYTKSLIFRLDDPDWNQVKEVVDELQARGHALLFEAGVDPRDVRFEVGAEMRYIGQGFEITVPLDLEIIEREDSEGLAIAFEEEYKKRFDRVLNDMPAEVISWRVRAVSPPVVTQYRLPSALSSQARQPRSRRVYFEEIGGYVPVGVFERDALEEGATLKGPAIIQEADSTVVVGPSANVSVSGGGHLIMTMADNSTSTRVNADVSMAIGERTTDG